MLRTTPGTSSTSSCLEPWPSFSPHQRTTQLSSLAPQILNIEDFPNTMLFQLSCLLYQLWPCGAGRLSGSHGHNHNLHQDWKVLSHVLWFGFCRGVWKSQGPLWTWWQELQQQWQRQWHTHPFLRPIKVRNWISST